MEKTKRYLYIVLLCLLSFGSIKAQEQQIEFFMTETEENAERTLYICLTEEQTIMGFQLEVFFPNGMSLITDNPIGLNNSLSGYTLQVHDFGGGHYLILAYDMELEGTTINSGELLRCHFLLSPDMPPGDYPLVVSNIKLAKDAFNAVCPKPYEGCLCLDESGATTIRLNKQNRTESNIYDLSGRQIGNGKLSNRKHRKGVIIRNRKKTLVTE